MIIYYEGDSKRISDARIDLLKQSPIDRTKIEELYERDFIKKISYTINSYIIHYQSRFFGGSVSIPCCICGAEVIVAGPEIDCKTPARSHLIDCPNNHTLRVFLDSYVEADGD